MVEVVINRCFGGFDLSHKAVMRYAELKGIKLKASLHFSSGELKVYDYTTEDGEWFFPRDIPRDDPALVQVVRELGSEADGMFASLKIVSIPDDVEWEIEEYDGKEWVSEVHRRWE